MNARDTIRRIAEKHGITVFNIRGNCQMRQATNAISRARWEACATLADNGYTQGQIATVLCLHVDTVRRGIKIYRANHAQIEAVRAKKCKASEPVNDNHEHITERQDLERRSDELLRLIAMDLRRLVA